MKEKGYKDKREQQIRWLWIWTASASTAWGFLLPVIPLPSSVIARTY
jgi:hypothetical protein